MKNEQKSGLAPVLKNGSLDLPSRETIQAFVRQEPLVPRPLFYDINQAAAALNMSTKSVRRLIKRGKLTCCKAVRKILIPVKQIEDFLKASCDVPKFNS